MCATAMAMHSSGRLCASGLSGQAFELMVQAVSKARKGYQAAVPDQAEEVARVCKRERNGQINAARFKATQGEA